MAKGIAQEGEPPQKRQKPESIQISLAGSLHNTSPPSFAPNSDSDSSFDFNERALAERPALNTDSYILDLTKYIPIGCLRMKRSSCALSPEDWQSCSSWLAFSYPRDVYHSQAVRFLPTLLQEKLMNSPILHSYRGLNNSGWIRMEFKCNNQNLGRVRVYVLPEDIGRGTINRNIKSLRKAMLLLLSKVDISRAIWTGQDNLECPIIHIDTSLDKEADDQSSLFHIFNTLPSPSPDPTAVNDCYAQDAMYRLLESNIDGLTTTLHSYQRRSAALMLQREVQPSQLLDPRFKEMVDQRGNTWYCDIDAGLCFREPRTYEAARGGICAETMGLGKTLICLALILATRDLSSKIPVEYSVGTIPIRKKTGSLLDMAAATLGRTGTPWKRDLASLEAQGFDFARCKAALQRNRGYYFLPSPQPRRVSRNPSKIPPRKIWLTTATLVVVPSNLVQQWIHEINKHTCGLKVLVMDSLREVLPPAEKLIDYDIILFSKQRFEKEAKDGTDSQGRKAPWFGVQNVCRCPYIRDTREKDCTCLKEESIYHSPLKELHFKRLITDEGHPFGNSSGRTEAVTVVEFLQLSARWIVSGTPTQGLYGVENVAIGAVGKIGKLKSKLESEAPQSNSPHSASYNHIKSLITTPELSLADGGTNSEVAIRMLKGISEASPVISRTLPQDLSMIDADSDTSNSEASEQERLFNKQERKDLEKLGTIAAVYLKARPWANTFDNDRASWAQLVMQPRHGSGSHGNMECLRATLEGMIIRHRPEDVAQEVTLPPLHHNVVYLDGSIQNKLSLNTYSMMIITNAVTSERKDVDYFFHPRQRKNLLQLVSNLRQSSFFWSGFGTDHVRSTVENAKGFLEKRTVPISPEDEALLKQAIKTGEAVLSNSISNIASKWHEMTMYIDINCPDDVKKAWSLDETSANPMLMGATMVYNAQKFVESQSWKEEQQLMDDLAVCGLKSLEAAAKILDSDQTSRNLKRKSPTKDTAITGKSTGSAPALAGNVTVGEETSPNKRARFSSGKYPTRHVEVVPDSASLSRFNTEYKIDSVSQGSDSLRRNVQKKPTKSALKSSKPDISGTLDPASSLASTKIISTASAKLSYLMDRISIQQATEKILVFYEAENVAYYIAQALECLGIKHLIYAKTLSSARRSQYVVTFNESEVFRVLLMDVSQAAFGLDLSSASRVYFVNPVFSPQVEAQAVKRAHRIGQVKPVYVETLVLRGSIEEAILERRKDMSNEEHNKCKNILDDQKMYDWIRNVSFLPIPDQEIPGPEQMAKLKSPQNMFSRSIGDSHDPDADLIFDKPGTKGKGKMRSQAYFPSLPTTRYHGFLASGGVASALPGLSLADYPVRDSQRSSPVGSLSPESQAWMSSTFHSPTFSTSPSMGNLDISKKLNTPRFSNFQAQAATISTSSSTLPPRNVGNSSTIEPVAVDSIFGPRATAPTASSYPITGSSSSPTRL